MSKSEEGNCIPAESGHLCHVVVNSQPVHKTLGSASLELGVSRNSTGTEPGQGNDVMRRDDGPGAGIPRALTYSTWPHAEQAVEKRGDVTYAEGGSSFVSTHFSPETPNVVMACLGNDTRVKSVADLQKSAEVGDANSPELCAEPGYISCYSLRHDSSTDDSLQNSRKPDHQYVSTPVPDNQSYAGTAESQDRRRHTEQSLTSCDMDMFGSLDQVYEPTTTPNEGSPGDVYRQEFRFRSLFSPGSSMSSGGSSPSSSRFRSWLGDLLHNTSPAHCPALDLDTGRPRSVSPRKTKRGSFTLPSVKQHGSRHCRRTRDQRTLWGRLLRMSSVPLEKSNLDSLVKGKELAFSNTNSNQSKAASLEPQDSSTQGDPSPQCLGVTCLGAALAVFVMVLTITLGLRNTQHFFLQPAPVQGTIYKDSGVQICNLSLVQPSEAEVARPFTLVCTVSVGKQTCAPAVLDETNRIDKAQHTQNKDATTTTTTTARQLVRSLAIVKVTQDGLHDVIVLAAPLPRAVSHGDSGIHAGGSKLGPGGGHRQLTMAAEQAKCDLTGSYVCKVKVINDHGETSIVHSPAHNLTVRGCHHV